MHGAPVGDLEHLLLLLGVGVAVQADQPSTWSTKPVVVVQLRQSSACTRSWRRLTDTRSSGEPLRSPYIRSVMDVQASSADTAARRAWTAPARDPWWFVGHPGVGPGDSPLGQPRMTGLGDDDSAGLDHRPSGLPTRRQLLRQVAVDPRGDGPAAYVASARRVSRWSAPRARRTSAGAGRRRRSLGR